jgi:hypothetical protein
MPTDATHEELVDELWTACKERHRKRSFCDPNNGRGILAERKDDGVLFRITTKLWREQPSGVLYGHDLYDLINKEGRAVLADVYPRSFSVASDVMPHEHVAVKIVPTEIWLEQRGLSLSESEGW